MDQMSTRRGELLADAAAELSASFEASGDIFFLPTVLVQGKPAQKL